MMGRIFFKILMLASYTFGSMIGEDEFQMGLQAWSCYATDGRVVFLGQSSLRGQAELEALSGCGEKSGRKCAVYECKRWSEAVGRVLSGV